jgi:hypothetical protein
MLTGWFTQPEGPRSSTEEPRSSEVDDDTQVMEPDQGNGKLPQSPGRLCFRNVKLIVGGSTVVLSHIISQLRPGADLSRVVLPTFILEPRSMLERITKCARLAPFHSAAITNSRTCALTHLQLHVPPRDAVAYPYHR